MEEEARRTSTLSATMILAMSVGLGSCASQIIPDHLNAVVGQPISILIAKLGYPTDERVIAGQKVYIWSTNSFVSGTSYGCTIRVFVDSSDIVRTSDAEGNEGGCAGFAEQLIR